MSRDTSGWLTEQGCHGIECEGPGTPLSVPQCTGLTLTLEVNSAQASNGLCAPEKPPREAPGTRGMPGNTQSRAGPGGAPGTGGYLEQAEGGHPAGAALLVLRTQQAQLLGLVQNFVWLEEATGPLSGKEQKRPAARAACARHTPSQQPGAPPDRGRVYLRA